MKFNLLLTGLVVVCASSSLMSMEKGNKKERLNFLLDTEFCITGYSKENMKFRDNPVEFVGKSIFDVVPLAELDRTAIACGFGNAVTKKETVKVSYELDTMMFAAKITALKMGNKKYNYFVKVTQVDSRNQ
jgi:hypothetical protein